MRGGVLSLQPPPGDMPAFPEWASMEAALPWAHGGEAGIGEGEDPPTETLLQGPKCALGSRRWWIRLASSAPKDASPAIMPIKLQRVPMYQNLQGVFCWCWVAKSQGQTGCSGLQASQAELGPSCSASGPRLGPWKAQEYLSKAVLVLSY